MPRFLEDLLIWRETDPGHVLDDAAGLYGQPHETTVAELLRKVKISFVSTSPDDWYEASATGDSDNANYAGFNENRVAYQDGWVFPAQQQLFDARRAGDVRDLLLRKYTGSTGQPVTEKAAFLTLEWAEYATIWDHLDYTVTGSWGGWAGSESGLGADSISFETACEAIAGAYDPPLFQLFVDNVRAATETGVVLAAQRAGKAGGGAPTTYDLGGSVGFLETGRRVTSADGPGTAPPAGHPGTPLYPQVEQAPYDVSNTDYFRDLREIVRTPVVEVPAREAGARAAKLDSLVVADTDDADPAALARFARDGGNLVLTDGALQLLPKVAGLDAEAVRQGHAYVGYADLNRSHPWTEGLYKRARQTFDPVGLGMPLLMERDQYWPCGTSCEESPTVNSAPVWTVDRAAWERAGGTTVGTADPPADRKFGGEGTRTDKTTIGSLPLGKGRVVVFGGLLPQPSEAFDHWFGLNGYTLSVPAQQMLLRALRWDDGRPAEDPAAARRECRSRRSFVIRLPKRVKGRRVVRGRVTVDGRRVKVRRVRGRLTALVDLRLKPRKTVRVRVVSRTRGGRKAVQIRRFRTCAKREPARKGANRSG